MLGFLKKIKLVRVSECCEGKPTVIKRFATQAEANEYVSLRTRQIIKEYESDGHTLTYCTDEFGRMAVMGLHKPTVYLFH